MGSLTQITVRTISDAPSLAYLLVFLGGLFTGFSPCVLPFFPVVIGYVAKCSAGENYSRAQGFFLSLAFILGFSFVFTLFGAFASFLGGFLNPFNPVWHFVVGIVFVVVGLHFMKLFQLNLSLPFSFRVRNFDQKGMLGALILSVLLGLALSPCATPVVAAILTYAATKGNVLYGASLLFTYSLAHGIPIMIAGISTGAFASVSKIQRHRNAVELVSGALFVLLGFYFLLRG